MAAIIYRKRSLFEDLQSPPPISASSPVSNKLRSSCFSTYSILFDQLRALFPEIHTQLLEKALGESGNDLDAAIRSLHELRIGFSDGKLDTEEIENGMKPTTEPAAQSEDPSAENNFPANGVEWVDCFVREMMTATSIDDARDRATRLLESLEKCISSRAGAEAAQNFHKRKDDAILKRAVVIQHERQKEYDERSQEVQQLKQLIAQGKEQLRTLEMNNYALKTQLRQAQQSNSLLGFKSDVF
uniref:CUE domain-containing protein n=1 Tax=Solanum lycopersicum TaxID=4081 RepID=A0A3Q7JAD1_SOLLC